MHYLQTQNTNYVICITIDKYYHYYLIRTITETAIHQKKDNTFHISRTKYDNNSFRADNLSLHILTHCPRFRQIVTIHPLERHRVLKTGDSFVRRRFEKGQPQYTAYLLLAYE